MEMGRRADRCGTRRANVRRECPASTPGRVHALSTQLLSQPPPSVGCIPGVMNGGSTDGWYRAAASTLYVLMRACGHETWCGVSATASQGVSECLRTNDTLA